MEADVLFTKTDKCLREKSLTAALYPLTESVLCVFLAFPLTHVVLLHAFRILYAVSSEFAQTEMHLLLIQHLAYLEPLKLSKQKAKKTKWKSTNSIRNMSSVVLNGHYIENCVEKNLLCPFYSFGHVPGLYFVVLD